MQLSIFGDALMVIRFGPYKLFEQDQFFHQSFPTLCILAALCEP